MNPNNTVQFLNLGLRGGTLVIKFAFILALAYFLEPNEVGLYGLITATVAYSIFFFGFEFYSFSTRYLVGQSKKDWPDYLVSEIALFIILYVLILPILSILFYLDFLPWTIFFSFSIIVILEHLSIELMRLLVADQHPIVATLTIFLKQAFWAIFYTILIWLDPSARSIELLLLFWMAGLVTSIAVGILPFVKLPWYQASWNIQWDWIKRGLMVAIPLLISSISVKSMFTVDRYVFEYLNDMALLGAYSIYMGVATAMLSFMDSGVFVFYYPKMLKAFSSDDLGAFKQAYKDLVKRSAQWLCVLIGGALLTGYIVFPKLGNPIYADNYMLFSAMVGVFSIFIVGNVFQYGLYSTRNDKDIIYANVLGLLVAAITLALLLQATAYWAVPLAMAIGCIYSTIHKILSWARVYNKLDLSKVKLI